MAITRRPHRRVGPRLYQYTDAEGGYFVRVEGYNGREVGPHISTHKIDLPVRSTLADAMQLRDRVYADLDAGRYLRADDLSLRPWTLGDATDRFIESKRASWRAGSMSSNQSRARQWESLRSLPLLALRRTHVEALVARVERETGAVHARNTLFMLRAVLRFAISWGQLPTSPAEAVQLYAPPESPVEVLPDVATIHRFLAALQRIDEQADVRHGVGVIARLQYYAAMRPGEAVAVRRSWIDVEDCTVRLPASAVKTKRAREFPISLVMLDALNAHRSWLLEHGTDTQQAEAARSGGLCFPRPVAEGPILVHDYGMGRWAKACHEVGLVPGRAGWSPHKLRYAGISRMLAAGMDRRLVMSMVGHTGESVSWHYSKPFANEIEAARPVLARLDSESRLEPDALNVRSQEGYNQGTNPNAENSDADR